MAIAARGVQRPVAPLLAIAALFGSLARAGEPIPSEESSEARTALERSWEEAQAAELAGIELDRERPELAVAYFRRAGQIFEFIAQQRSESVEASDAYWRSARSFWLTADTLPRDAKEERESLYVRSEALAERGIEVNPECGECMLWKFSSMGRLATSRGIWTAGRQIPVMADLLDRGIALQPNHADNDQNSVLGNLHYSSAIFYRVLPDWFFMTWFFGVRGDKERSLEHIRKALALHPARLEYQVELGSQFLCLGTTNDDAEQLVRGREVLLDAIQREAKSLDDEREIEAARIMLHRPRKACGYSGEAWLEIEREKAERLVGK